MKRLEGKKALVTGGSRGMGAAIARRLAAEGADVALTYANSAEKAQAVVADIEKAGRRGLAIAANNEAPEAVAAAVEQAVKAFGGLDILVNNAGIFIAKAFDEYTLEDYEKSMAVNTRAVFLASQAAARHLPEGGRIINIGSNLAERVYGPSMSLYAMSKSALNGFTRGLARDLGARRITVNLVQPGATDTDMNPADGAHSNIQRSFMAIPQYGSATDIAGLVTWLAGDEARSVTGAFFTIDGGTNS